MNKEERQGLTQKPKEKAPYQKPSFRYESVFETSALVCGKVQNGTAGCHGANNRKAS
jgi:hypothetical protein